MDCGITNLGSCLTEKFFEFLVYVLNQPIKPLLDVIKNLLTEPVNIAVFAEVWAVVIYILSMFYGFLLLISGFRFIVSGYSSEQREKAKQELRNIILMMVFIQLSFFVYSLALDLFSSISAVIFNMIDPVFFNITADNLLNIGLEISMLIPYLISIVLTLLFLTIRYICVSVGVLFFAIGLFFYFINALNSYGKLVLNYLGVLIALPVFYCMVFLASSKLLEIEIFANLKMLVMTGAFGLVNIGTLFLLLFVIIKTANAVSGPAKQVATIVSAMA